MSVVEHFHLNPFEHIQVNFNNNEIVENSDEDEEEGLIREEIEPRPLWNILLFAIKYDKTETVEVLMEQEELDIMAIVEPPANNQDFHVNRDQYYYNEIKNQIAFEMAI